MARDDKLPFEEELDELLLELEERLVEEDERLDEEDLLDDELAAPEEEELDIVADELSGVEDLDAPDDEVPDDDDLVAPEEEEFIAPDDEEEQLEAFDDELKDAESELELAPPSPPGLSSWTTLAPQLVASDAVTATSQPRRMTHLAVVPSFIVVLFLWRCTDRLRDLPSRPFLAERFAGVGGVVWSRAAPR